LVLKQLDWISGIISRTAIYTALGIERSDEVLVFSLVTRPCTEEQKKMFYADLVHELHEQLCVRQEDVMVNLSVNSDADWSFGPGRAQFLTGEL
jgi:hypothetical protein